jgi:hypothetical protein
VFVDDGGERGLGWMGRHQDRYVPIGEQAELEMGDDGRILLEARRVAFRRVNLAYDNQHDLDGWDIEEEWALIVRNTRSEAVALEVWRHFGGDFDFVAMNDRTASDGEFSWEKSDEDSWELKADLPGRTEARFAYSITTRQGSRARR